MSKGYRDGTFGFGLAVGAFGLLAVFVAVHFFYQEISASPNSVHSTAHTGDQCGEGDKPVWGPYWGICFVLSDTIAQWIMMAFTVIAAGLLYGTLRQANKTNVAAINAANAAGNANEIARSNFERSNRAWLYVRLGGDGEIIDSDLDGVQINNGFMFVFDIVNSGGTPAREVHTGAFHKMLRRGRPIPTFEIDPRII